MQNSIFDFKLFAIADFDQQNTLAERRVLVLTAEPDKQPLLLKILSAAKLTEADFAIVQLPPSVGGLNIAQLRQHIAPKEIIMFGIPLTAVGLQINPPQYQLFEWANARWLFAHSLAKIEENPTFKKALWLSIQKMFTV